MLKFYYVYSTRRVTRNSTLFTEHSVRLYLLHDGDLKSVYNMTDKFTGEMQIVKEAAIAAGALDAKYKDTSVYELAKQNIAVFTSL